MRACPTPARPAAALRRLHARAPARARVHDTARVCSIRVTLSSFAATLTEHARLPLRFYHAPPRQQLRYLSVTRAEMRSSAARSVSFSESTTGPPSPRSRLPSGRSSSRPMCRARASKTAMHTCGANLFGMGGAMLACAAGAANDDALVNSAIGVATGP